MTKKCKKAKAENKIQPGKAWNFLGINSYFNYVTMVCMLEVALICI